MNPHDIVTARVGSGFGRPLEVVLTPAGHVELRDSGRSVNAAFAVLNTDQARKLAEGLLRAVEG